MNIIKNIEPYITSHKLLSQNDTIVIGLSGGPDSVFLLHTLKSLQEKYNLTLIAAHLNHEWRPEADSEQELCHTLAQRLNIPFVSAKLSSLSTTKKYNGSKEEYARSMRRHFLQEVARKHKANSIALGHHAQDQQETFFIRLIRGTSLAGLTGMHARHGLYIRPLLETNKSDILEWLKSNGIAYAIDSSNESSHYLRNRIRKSIIGLEQCDERWNDNFISTISRLKEDDALLNSIADSTLNGLLTKKNDADDDVFDVKQFFATHASLHYRIIILWLIRNNVQFSVTQAFLDEIIRFLSHEHGGIHALHKEWRLIKKKGLVWIEKRRFM